MNAGWSTLSSFLLLHLAAALAAGTGATTACRTVTLNPAPSWASSMAWSPNGGELVIGDTLAGRLLRYEKDGRFLGAEGPQKTAFGEYRPTRILTTRTGFLVQSRAYEWFEFDSQFKLLRHLDPGLPLRFAMVDGVLSGDELFGFATFRKPNDTWSFGLQRVKLSPLQLIQTLEEIPLDSRAGILYTTLLPEVAVAGGNPYALRFDEPSYLLNARTNRRLKAFPKGFDRLPVFPSISGPDATIPREKVMERSTMPVALYGSGTYLFVLTRRPASDGKTIWELHRVDPVKDVVTGSVVLPTSAPDLTLAPGSELWAILEKGTLTAPTTREMKSLLLVPAAAIEKGNGKIPCP
jgi:hypothetical protein